MLVKLPVTRPFETTTDASDLATALTLVNSLKDEYNELVKSYNSLLTELRTARVGE